MTLADVLDGMFRLFLAHWRVYAIALGVILLPLHFVLAYLGQEMGTSTGLLEQLQNPAVAQATFARGPQFGTLAAVGVIGFVAAVFIQPFLTGVSCTIAAEAYEGGDPQAGAVLRSTRSRYWSLVGVNVLLGLIGFAIFIVPLGLLIAGAVSGADGGLVAGGLLLFAFVPVAIWVFVRLALAHVAVVVERVGPVTALRRSWELATGRWWRVAGTLLLAGIVTAIVSSIVSFPFTLPGTLFGAWLGVVFVTIGAVLADIVTTPLTANAETLLYFDGRIRSEGYDLAAMTRDLAGPGQFPPGQYPPPDRPFG